MEKNIFDPEKKQIIWRDQSPEVNTICNFKTPYKQKCRTRWSQRQILPNIQRTYTNPSQTLPENWTRGNTPKDILWSHHHPDTKTRERHHQKRKHDDPKPMGCSKSSSKREVYSNTILPQETRKISHKQPKLTPKAIRERRTKNPKVSRRKEIIKIISEINEKEMKETIAKINKTKSWFFEKINKIDKP